MGLKKAEKLSTVNEKRSNLEKATEVLKPRSRLSVPQGISVPRGHSIPQGGIGLSGSGASGQEVSHSIISSSQPTTQTVATINPTSHKLRGLSALPLELALDGIGAAPHLNIGSDLTVEDFEDLFAISTSQIVCFSFDPGIPTELPADEIFEKLWQSNSRCLCVSQAFAEARGYLSPDELQFRPFSTLFPKIPPFTSLMRHWISRSFVLGGFEIRDRVANRSVDGPERVLQYSVYSLPKNGRIDRLWFVVRDVSDLHRALDDVAKGERHYRTLVENSGFIMVRYEPSGRYLYISPQVRSVVGYEPEDFNRIPNLFESLLHPDDVIRHAPIEAARKSRLPITTEARYRLRCLDGSYRWFLERQTPKLADNGEIEFFDSVALDIDETKQLEANLAHAQKMETLGTVAGGIAHDFNNHLTALLGQITIALETLDRHHPSYSSLASAERAALQCAEMTSSLLSFARKSDFDLRALNLGQTVEDSVKLLRRMLPETITVTVEGGEDSSLVRGNSVHLQQVIMNLILNSRDAMPRGGSIQIRVRQAARHDIRKTEILPSQIELYMLVEVQDTGDGIRPEHVERIFEPFFTTKEAGYGTGLGLSMAYSIIKAHNGWIWVESALGSGTSFYMLLPKAQHSLENERRGGVEHAPSGTETILIADDDPMVLSMMSAALQMKGYKIIQATNGEDAHRILSTPKSDQSGPDHSGDVIQLAIIDQTMPRMTGREVISSLSTIRPELPVILTTGHALSNADLHLHDTAQCPSTERPPTTEQSTSTGESTTKGEAGIKGDTVRAFSVLQKPYPLGDLLHLIRSLLDRPRAQERDN